MMAARKRFPLAKLVLLILGLLFSKSTTGLEGKEEWPELFSCDGRHEGHYADPATRCKVFHLCKNGVQYSFVCPKGTLFNEDIATCDWKSNVVCKRSNLAQAHSLGGGATFRPRTNSSTLSAGPREKIVYHDQENPIYFREFDLESPHRTPAYQFADVHSLSDSFQRDGETQDVSEKNSRPYGVSTLINDDKHIYVKENLGSSLPILIIFDDLLVNGNVESSKRLRYTDATQLATEHTSEQNFYTKNKGKSQDKEEGLAVSTLRPKIRIYDRHLHNLSNHSINPDVIISVQKKFQAKQNNKIPKISGQEKFPPHQDRHEKFPVKPTTTPPATISSLQIFPRASNHLGRNFSIPMLTPRDILSSLYLQSLLVDALDGRALTPASSVQLVAPNIEQEETSASLNVDETATAYRYRKMFFNSAVQNGTLIKEDDAKLLDSSVTDFNELKNEKNFVKEIFTQQANSKDFNVNNTISSEFKGDSGNREMEVVEKFSQLEVEDSTEETAKSSGFPVELMKEFMQRLMNSTILISNDARIMVFNDESSSHNASSTLEIMNVTAMNEVVPRPKMPLNSFNGSSSKAEAATNVHQSVTQSSSPDSRTSNVSVDFKTMNIMEKHNLLDVNITQNLLKSTTQAEIVTPKSSEVIQTGEPTLFANFTTSGPQELAHEDIGLRFSETDGQNNQTSDANRNNLNIHIHIHSSSPNDLKSPNSSSDHPLEITKVASSLSDQSTTVSKSHYETATNSHAHLRHRPRLTFLPSIQFRNDEEYGIKKWKPVNPRYKKTQSNGQLKNEPTGFRVKFQDQTTKSPIEYEIIFSQKPPVVDGEVVPNPAFGSVFTSNTTNNKQHNFNEKPHISSPFLPSTGLQWEDSLISNRVPPRILNFHQTPLKFTERVRYRTLKPLTYFLEKNATYFPPLLPSSPVAPSKIALASKFGPGSSQTTSPLILPPNTHIQRSEYLSSPLLSHLSKRFPPGEDSGVKFEHPNGYIIPRENHYTSPSLKAMSAFNSLPDMFHSSYSVPLPIEPHSISDLVKGKLAGA